MVQHVFSCGSNGKGQLGLGDEEDYDQLIQVDIGSLDGSIVDISCGGNHTLISTDKNLVYCSGDNSKGQCSGITSTVFQEIPGNWKLASCGWEYSILVDTSNQVYSCGEGSKGELGLGQDIKLAHKLSKLPYEFPDEIISLKSSMSHTILQLKNGDFYGWGVSRKGQLGAGNGKCTWIPTKIETNITGESIDFNLGRDYSIIFSENHIEVLGDKSKFPGLETENITKAYVHTMWSSLHIEIKGELYSYGNNSHNQIFPRQEDSVVQLGTFRQFAVGSEHGLGIVNNQVYAWGWGEHGNCGKLEDTKENANSTGRKLNRIFSLEENVNHKVKSIYGGCATTWIITEDN